MGKRVFAIVLKAELYDAQTGRLLRRHRPGGGSSPSLLRDDLNIRTPRGVRLRPGGSYRVQSGDDFKNPATALPAPAPAGKVLTPLPTRRMPPHVESPNSALPVVRHISTEEGEGGVMRHLFWSHDPKVGADAVMNELGQRGFLINPQSAKVLRGGASHSFTANAPDGTTHHFHIFRSTSGGPSSTGFGAAFHSPPVQPAA